MRQQTHLEWPEQLGGGQLPVLIVAQDLVERHHHRRRLDRPIHLGNRVPLQLAAAECQTRAFSASNEGSRVRVRVTVAVRVRVRANKG